MRVLAARIGCDNSGYVWVADGTGDIERRNWRSGTVPEYPAIVKRGEGILDMIEYGVNIAMIRYSLPMYLKDEMRSEASLQVTRARRNVPDGNRTVMVTAAIRGAVDAVRREWGRTKDGSEPSEEMKNVRRPRYLEDSVSTDDGRGWEETLKDGQPSPGYAVSQVDWIKATLARLANDRHREVALRTACGQTEFEIGKILGVTESRVSQILAQIRGRLDETEGMDRWELESIPLEIRASHSLTVSWR